MIIPDLLEKRAKESPTKVWIFFKDHEITYKDADDAANKLANGLLRLGLEAGDKVAIFSRNCPEYLYSWFALGKIGAIMVPLNYSLKGEEVKYILNHSESKAIIVASDYLDLISDVRDDCKMLEQVLTLGVEPAANTISFSKLVEDSPSQHPQVKVTEDDISTIIYTSGTTGKPKGVMLSHLSYVGTEEAHKKAIPLTPDDRTLMVLPLFHINAQCYSTLFSLISGIGLIMAERFSTSRYWDWVRQYKVTHLQLLIGPLAMLLNMPERKEEREHSVRILSGPNTKELYEQAKKRFNIQYILNSYSLTECPLAIGVSLDEDYRDKCIGYPRETDEVKMEVKIFDEEDKEVPPGTPGEMVIKSPLVMRGYYRDPEETARALRGGWLHTGDSCYKDEEGRLYFLGRLKDIVRRGGELIAPLEVEAVLTSHPKIVDAAIIPVADKIRIEEVKAYIVLEEGEALEPLEIVDYCEQRLAGFKVPRYIEFRESLPKTATGRTRKFELKQEGNLTACWDREAKH